MDHQRILQRRARVHSDADDRDGGPGRTTATAHLQRRARGAPLPSGIVQRDGDGDGAVGADAEAAVSAAAGGSGAPLPAELRERFEASLGADLSAVRVHTGDASAEASDAIGAHAYTLGQDIHFAGGQYDPHSAAGQHLLAHEVAHTVQQAGGAASGTQAKMEVSQPGDALEVEADVAASAMIVGQPSTVTGGSVAIAREGKSTADETKTSVDPRKGEAPENADELWTAFGGDAFVKDMNGLATAWQGFRGQPTTGGDGMIGHGTLNQTVQAFKGRVAGELGDGTSNAFPTWVRERASSGVGAKNLTYIEEMYNLVWEGHDVVQVLNVKKLQKITHTYRVKAHNLALKSAATLSYENNLPSPWSWSKSITMMGIGISFGLKKFGPSLFSLEGEFETKDVLSYVGWNDFIGKTVRVLNLPTADAPVGASVSAGSILQFDTAQGQVSFENLGLKVNYDPKDVNWEELLKQFKNIKSVKQLQDFIKSLAKVNISAAEAAIGIVEDDKTKADVDTDDVPDKARLIDASKTFRATIHHFANGKFEVPADTEQILQQLWAQLDTFKGAELDPCAEGLSKHGITWEQNAQLNVSVNGWASLPWHAAKTDTERQALNEELSARRAEAIRVMLQPKLAIWPSTVAAAGKGSGGLDPDQKPTAEPDLEPGVKPNAQDAGEQALMRRVDVVIQWNGKLLDRAAPTLEGKYVPSDPP